MTQDNGPRYLNLDELDTGSDITIHHDGQDHIMVTLTVEKFIEQQKRAKTLEQESEKAHAEGKSVDDDDMANVVTLLKTSISEYFPTLPVDKLPVAKLFVIFGFLNDVSDKINSEASPKEKDTDEDVAGSDNSGNEGREED